MGTTKFCKLQEKYSSLPHTRSYAQIMLLQLFKTSNKANYIINLKDISSAAKLCNEVNHTTHNKNCSNSSRYARI